MAGRLKRTWNRLLRRHPQRKLLTPQPAGVRELTLGRDSLSIGPREIRHVRPATAMADYRSVETPTRSRPLALFARPPVSRVAVSSAACESTKPIISDTPVQNPIPVKIAPATATRTPFDDMCVTSSETCSARDSIEDDSGFESNEPALTRQSSPTFSICDHDMDARKPRARPSTVAQVADVSLCSSITQDDVSEVADGSDHVNDKIPVVVESLPVAQSSPVPAMHATSGPLNDYYTDWSC